MSAQEKTRTVISSRIILTHRPRGAIEAWRYTGQPVGQWPDWVRSHYDGRPDIRPTSARIGNWALRDDEGYFWRWIRNDLFAERYEPIAADK